MNKVFPDVNYVRAFSKGERIRVPSHHTPRLGIGARRKGYAQAAMIIAGAGVRWRARCVQWQYAVIYELVELDYAISRHD